MNSKFLTIIISFVSIAIFNCDSNEPIIVSVSDEITLNNKSRGFSFSRGMIIQQTDTITPYTDMKVFVNRIGITILGINLSSPDSIKTDFLLIKEFTRSDSSKVFFEHLNSVPDSNYIELAALIRPNQIWAIKTRENKFAKILVTDTIARLESTPTPGIVFFYAETKFRWKFQPNGTRYF